MLSCDDSLPFLGANNFLLPFENGEKTIFTAETVSQRNDPIFAKQALDMKRGEGGGGKKIHLY